MAYHIAVDSCTDLSPQMWKDEHIRQVPLTLIVGDEQIIDDQTFDQAVFLAKAALCESAPSSACPSPHAFMEAMGFDDEDAYCVTLSAQLSGSYNSALLGEQLLREEFPNKKMHVFNSRAACCGQSLIVMKIQECIGQGMDFRKVVSTVEEYISEETTLFVLESLDTLRKNGRLTGLQAKVINVLNIKPVMASTPEGSIRQADIGRGMKRAVQKMVAHREDTLTDPEDKTLAISHCNCPERAILVRKMVMEKYPFKDVVIFPTSGVGSLYAGDGGIVAAF